jgi:hypothetical protein
MRRRTQSVDFGPISLEIAHDGSSSGSWNAPVGEASLTDALRLKRLMSRGATSDSTHENLRVVQEDHVGEVAASIGHPPQFGEEMSRIFKLAVSLANSSSPIATSIKLQLSPDLLPSSELSVQKHTSGLSFDLYTNDLSVVGELKPIAQDLVDELGLYLSSPIRLRLFFASESVPEISKYWHWDQHR